MAAQQPVIPPHKLGLASFDHVEIRVIRVDNDIAFSLNNNGGHDQNRRPDVGKPAVAETFGNRRVGLVPPWDSLRIKSFDSQA